jgi:hypothetical protein
MDLGYVIILLLVLVYVSTAVILYVRARHAGSESEDSEPLSPQDPEMP